MISEDVPETAVSPKSETVEMVERVAAAIRASIKCDAAEPGPDGATVYLTGSVAAAHAAIEAMRRPTPQMTRAAVTEGEGPSSYICGEIYTAMIDAALNPGEPS